LGRGDGNNSKSWVRPKKNRGTKFISTSRPPRSCVHSHHAMFVGNTVDKNALKLYTFWLCHDPHSVNCDNLCSKTPIKNVKIEICTKFQEEDKTLRLWGYIMPCKKVHKNMCIQHFIYQPEPVLEIYIARTSILVERYENTIAIPWQGYTKARHGLNSP
jgi:hypothetical protein